MNMQRERERERERERGREREATLVTISYADTRSAHAHTHAQVSARENVLHTQRCQHRNIYDPTLRKTISMVRAFGSAKMGKNNTESVRV